MSRPEIVMQTPAAKKLEAEVQRKLAEYSYSTEDDVVMAEYVVVMLANAKTPDQITAELSELIGEDMYDPAFTTWLFEEVARQYGAPINSDLTPSSPSESQEKLFQSTNSNSRLSEYDLGDKIETVNDSRDHHGNYRGPAKRTTHPSTNPTRTGMPSNPNNRINQSGVFNQAVTGIKRVGTNDILRDTPPHRRPRQDDFSMPTPSNNLRPMDRNPRDAHWNNNNGAMLGRRDIPNGQRGPNNNFPVGHPMGAESAAKSILERVGVSVNPNQQFPNHNGFPGGYGHQLAQMPLPFRRPHEAGPNGRSHPSPTQQQQRMFYGSPSPYPLPILPSHPFPQQHFNPQNPANPSTPQLFLANGQPYIPPHPFQIPGSGPPAMYPYSVSQPLVNQSQKLPGSAQAPAPNSLPANPIPIEKRVGPIQPSEAEMGPLPTAPLLREECKYNLACKNAWCPSSHCSPKGNPKNSMLLSFYPCELQLKCTDPECLKAHVSPQQADPKSSIKVSTEGKPPSAAGLGGSPTSRGAANSKTIPCRFGSQCARTDCVFSHPWIVNSTSDRSNGTIIDKTVGNKNGYSHIPCKFGLQCTRPDCFYQHPMPPRIPSKNISKTFNSGKAETGGGAIVGLESAEKLAPSKKFSAAKPDSTITTTDGNSDQQQASLLEKKDDDKEAHLQQDSVAKQPPTRLNPEAPSSNPILESMSAKDSPSVPPSSSTPIPA